MFNPSSELGIAHSFQSFNTCYKDTGLWGIYFVTDKLNQENMIFNIQVMVFFNFKTDLVYLYSPAERVDASRHLRLGIRR